MDKDVIALIKSARKAYDIFYSNEKIPDYIKSNAEYELKASLEPFNFIEIEEDE